MRYFIGFLTLITHHTQKKKTINYWHLYMEAHFGQEKRNKQTKGDKIRTGSLDGTKAPHGGQTCPTVLSLVCWRR